MGAVPPFVGVAVNVTLVPAQIEVEEALMETDAVTALVETVMTLLTAFAVEVQLALDVNTTLTLSPFASVLDVNVAAFVPAFTPLICH
jgi:hypothetical protein